MRESEPKPFMNGAALVRYEPMLGQNEAYSHYKASRSPFGPINARDLFFGNARDLFFWNTPVCKITFVATEEIYSTVAVEEMSSVARERSSFASRAEISSAATEEQIWVDYSIHWL